jgi:hypothetical protein
MCRQLRWFALCALVTLLPMRPLFAADGSAPPAAGSPPPAATPPSASSTDEAPPAAPPKAPPPSPQEKKHRMSTGGFLLLSAGIGAGIGLTVGLISGHDALKDTGTGAGLGIAVPIALAAWAGSMARFRPAEIRPAEVYLLGAPVRGKPRQILPQAPGGAALGLAALRGGGESGSPGGLGGSRPILQYVIRW